MSHADLEDFLCDLGQESHNNDQDSSNCLLSQSAKVEKTGDNANDKSIQEFISDEQRVREFCKVRMKHSLEP